MTTPRAATPIVFTRPFLGVVVPLVYVATLAITIVVAAGGIGTRAPVGVPAAFHTVLSRPESFLRHAPKREHRAAAPSPKPAARPIRQPKTVRVAATPARTFRSVYSRSAERVETNTPLSPALVVRITSVTTPATMQTAINACSGPVEVIWDGNPLWGAHPTEIAEHDYCGGTAFTSLTSGDRVQVRGGDLSGTYVVNGRRRFAAAGSSAEQLDGIGDIALQTCVPGGVILIGLDRVG